MQQRKVGAWTIALSSVIIIGTTGCGQAAPHSPHRSRSVTSPQTPLWDYLRFAYRATFLLGSPRQRIVDGLGGPAKVDIGTLAGGRSGNAYIYYFGPIQQVTETLIFDTNDTLVTIKVEWRQEAVVPDLRVRPATQYGPQRTDVVWKALGGVASGPSTIAYQGAEFEQYFEDSRWGNFTTEEESLIPIAGAGRRRLMKNCLEGKRPDGRYLYIWAYTPPHVLARKRFNVQTSQNEYTPYRANPDFDWRSSAVWTAIVTNIAPDDSSTPARPFTRPMKL